MLHPTVPSSTPMDTCAPKIGALTPKICMAHYGQTVSAQWLLLTICRHSMLLLLTLLFSENGGTELTPHSHLLAFGHRPF